MKLQLNVTVNKEAIEKFWDEHPNLRALDHAAKLPSYEACVVREMSAAVEYDSIGFVTGVTAQDGCCHAHLDDEDHTPVVETKS